MKLRAFSPYFSEKVVLTMGSTLGIEESLRLSRATECDL